MKIFMNNIINTKVSIYPRDIVICVVHVKLDIQIQLFIKLLKRYEYKRNYGYPKQ